MSFSQLGQDTSVIEFYGGKKDGFFVDVGAFDGVSMSNTFLLEKKYNWTGICVEPCPSEFEKLISNRPAAYCCNSAVYNASDLIVKFNIANEDKMFSGISETINCHFDTVNKNKTVVDVKTISLTDLLDTNNAPRFIEYLSLDTEGSEYEILNAFNFKKYIFGLIDVEHNYIEPRRTQIKNLLTENNYILLRENQWDDSYKHWSI